MKKLMVASLALLVAGAVSVRAADAKENWEKHCAKCHGPDGKGVLPQAPNFTNPEYIASRPATQLYQAVSGGKGIMPAWQDRLSSDERWAAVEYVRSFGYKPAK